MILVAIKIPQTIHKNNKCSILSLSSGQQIIKIHSFHLTLKRIDSLARSESKSLGLFRVPIVRIFRTLLEISSNLEEEWGPWRWQNRQNLLKLRPMMAFWIHLLQWINLTNRIQLDQTLVVVQEGKRQTLLDWEKIPNLSLHRPHSTKVWKRVENLHSKSEEIRRLIPQLARFIWGQPLVLPMKIVWKI